MSGITKVLLVIQANLCNYLLLNKTHVL